VSDPFFAALDIGLVDSPAEGFAHGNTDASKNFRPKGL